MGLRYPRQSAENPVRGQTRQDSKNDRSRSHDRPPALCVRRAPWESLGNQTSQIVRMRGYLMDSATRSDGQNATAPICLDRLSQIPKPCAKVRILPGAPKKDEIRGCVCVTSYRVDRAGPGVPTPGPVAVSRVRPVCDDLARTRRRISHWLWPTSGRSTCRQLAGGRSNIRSNKGPRWLLPAVGVENRQQGGVHRVVTDMDDRILHGSVGVLGQRLHWGVILTRPTLSDCSQCSLARQQRLSAVLGGVTSGRWQPPLRSPLGN